MLRACCFAWGFFIALWGGAFLMIDKLVLFSPPEGETGIRGMLVQQQIEQERRPVIDPADWTAFTLMSIGSVTMLYSVALPRKSSS
jgi:hypothetical protein